MYIRAVNSVSNAKACQPIKPVNFGEKTGKQDVSIIPETPAEDTFVPPETLEKKYNMACLLAAYYKTQYEALSKQGCCNA